MYTETIPFPKKKEGEENTIALLGPMRMAALFWRAFEATPKNISEPERLSAAATALRAEFAVTNSDDEVIANAQKYRRLDQGAKIHERRISPGAKAEEE